MRTFSALFFRAARHSANGTGLEPQIQRGRLGRDEHAQLCGGAIADPGEREVVAESAGPERGGVAPASAGGGLGNGRGGAVLNEQLDHGGPILQPGLGPLEVQARCWVGCLEGRRQHQGDRHGRDIGVLRPDLSWNLARPAILSPADAVPSWAALPTVAGTAGATYRVWAAAALGAGVIAIAAGAWARRAASISPSAS